MFFAFNNLGFASTCGCFRSLWWCSVRRWIFHSLYGLHGSPTWVLKSFSPLMGSFFLLEWLGLFGLFSPVCVLVLDVLVEIFGFAKGYTGIEFLFGWVGRRRVSDELFGFARFHGTCGFVSVCWFLVVPSLKGSPWVVMIKVGCFVWCGCCSELGLSVRKSEDLVVFRFSGVYLIGALIMLDQSHHLVPESLSSLIFGFSMASTLVGLLQFYLTTNGFGSVFAMDCGVHQNGWLTSEYVALLVWFANATVVGFSGLARHGNLFGKCVISTRTSYHFKGNDIQQRLDGVLVSRGMFQEVLSNVAVWWYSDGPQVRLVWQANSRALKVFFTWIEDLPVGGALQKMCSPSSKFMLHYAVWLVSAKCGDNQCPTISSAFSSSDFSFYQVVSEVSLAVWDAPSIIVLRFHWFSDVVLDPLKRRSVPSGLACRIVGKLGDDNPFHSQEMALFLLMFNSLVLLSVNSVVLGVSKVLGVLCICTVTV